MYKLKPNLEEIVLKFKGQIPLLCEMKNTNQDVVWHAEGNVYVHVQMCLEALYRLFDGEAGHLSHEDKKVLFWAVALHDIGKSLTTRTLEEDRVYVKSPRHELVGASELLHIAPIDGLSVSQWLQVIKLVAYHQKPKHLVLDDAKPYQYLSLLRDVENLELMYFLEKADMQGRISEDRQDQIEYIDLFWLECKSIFNGMTYTQYKEVAKDKLTKLVDPARLESTVDRAIDDVCSGDIFMVEEAVSKQYMFEERPTVTLTIGCSGSGKSTYVEKYLPGAQIISYDLIRQEVNKCRTNQDNFDEIKRIGEERLKIALRKNHNIVWDATSTRIDFRDKVIRTARAYGALVKIVVFVKDELNLHKDNLNREYPVPIDVLDKQIHTYQMPSASESQTIIWWDAVNKQEIKHLSL